MKAFFLRHPRLQRWLPSPLTALLLLAIVYVWFRPPAPTSHPNQPLPDLTVWQLNGQPLSFSSLRGKVVLVNFWASWCPYCLHEMPQITTFYRDYRARGFTVITLSMDDNPNLATKYLHDHQDDVPAAMADTSVEQAFGGIDQLPTSFIIDRQGIVRDKVSGQVYYAKLQQLVEPLLQDH